LDPNQEIQIQLSVSGFRDRRILFPVLVDLLRPDGDGVGVGVGGVSSGGGVEGDESLMMSMVTDH
jgi:hypothetical protein